MRQEMKGVAPIVAGLVLIVAVVAAVGVWYVTKSPVEERVPMPPEVRAVEWRDVALLGESPAPEPEIGEFTSLDVIPKRQYFIAFSNGEMADAWREVFVRDMQSWGLKYSKEFGIKYTWTNAFGDAVRQLSDIESLLAQRPDFLIVSPQDSVTLATVYDMCNTAEIPFMTVDRSIPQEPGTDMYVTEIIGNNYKCGIARGLSIVEYLTQKYGRPAGHIVEITGLQTADIGVERSAGTYRILGQYPDIRVIANAEGGWDTERVVAGIGDLLMAHPDVDVISVDEEVHEGGLTVIKERGRTDIAVFDIDGHVDTFRQMCDPVDGKIIRGTVEYAPNYGLFAIATVIQYLNGENVNERYILPSRVFTNLDEERAAIIGEFYQKFQDTGVYYPMGEWGYYGELGMEEEIQEYYPTPYAHWEIPGFLEEYPAFEIDPPLETWPPG